MDHWLFHDDKSSIKYMFCNSGVGGVKSFGDSLVYFSVVTYFRGFPALQELKILFQIDFYSIWPTFFWGGEVK